MSPAAAALAGTLSGLAGRALLRLPVPIQRALGGPAPPDAPDLPVEARALARVAARVEPDPPEDPRALGSPAARAAFAAQARAIGARPRFDGHTEERRVPGADGPLPARLYVPHAAPAPAPLLVFFHGGGWVRGNPDSHDRPCRMLAQRSGARVLSVEYRKAPEHPFPAAPDDALAAWAHVTGEPWRYGADPDRIAVGGDSAGGNLAAVLALDARERGLPAPAFQLLVYPGTDFSRKHPSVHAFAEGFLLSEADIDRYKALYAPDRSDWEHPRASPLLAADLKGLPPALVVTGAADPLRDEGEAYASRLREAGVAVELHRHPHLHGFLNMTGSRGADAGLAVMADALVRALRA